MVILKGYDVAFIVVLVALLGVIGAVAGFGAMTITLVVFVLLGVCCAIYNAGRGRNR